MLSRLCERGQRNAYHLPLRGGRVTLTCMPEGDSVYQLARRLSFLRGRRVLRSSVRVPAYASVDFTGLKVERVWPYGKHLFMQIGNNILHTHLKMEGAWAVHEFGAKWRKPGHTARVVLEVEGTPHPRPIEVVGHSLGFVHVFPADEYPQRIAHLGPDVLGAWEPDDRAEAYRRITAEPGRSIGAALLDQTNLAGVGNEYRAEICFLAGVHPARTVASVDVHRILEITHALMDANRNSPVRVTTGVKRAGETTYVFGRNNKPCRRCGKLIVNGMLGGPDAGGRDGELERVIWWCPRCQPLEV
ncbi:endonuclease VIII [Corynebacterium renale]|nr:endonuclease VIII [Corynebacterium renale]STC94760.1 endonuclease VIII [Corynebacterium renale]